MATKYQVKSKVWQTIVSGLAVVGLVVMLIWMMRHLPGTFYFPGRCDGGQCYGQVPYGSGWGE